MTQPTQSDGHAFLLDRALRAQLLSLQIGEITIDQAVETMESIGMSANEALFRLSTAPVDEMFPLEISQN